MSRFFQLFLVALWLIGVSADAIGRQGDDLQYREFKNAAGEVLVYGWLRDSDGFRMTVMVAGSEAKQVRLDDLCKEDRDWVRDELKARKLKNEADEAYNELAGFAVTGKDQLILKGIKKVRGYNESASVAGPLLLEILANDKLQVRVRREALLAFIDTSKLDPTSANTVLIVIRDRWATCAPLIEIDVDEFLATYSRFGDDSVPYIKTVAYTGELKPNLDRAATLSAPKTFEFIDETVSTHRAAACRTFGKMKHAESLDLIFDVLAVAEMPVEGKADEITIKACLEALGENALVTDKVEETLKRYETQYPDLVSRVRTKLQKSLPKD